MGKLGGNGINSNELYLAVKQALEDQAGSGGGGGETFPDLIVPNTSNYTIPDGYNAIIKASVFNGGTLRINGVVVLQSVNTAWAAIRQNGNIYTTSGSPSAGGSYVGTYRRGALNTGSIARVSGGNATDVQGGNIFSNRGFTYVNTSSDGGVPFSAVFTNSTAYTRDSNNGSYKVGPGTVITGSGSRAFLAELYLI